jgi:hypothetical protein
LVATIARVAGLRLRANSTWFRWVAALPMTIFLTGLASAESAASSHTLACDSAKKHSCEELVQDNILWKIDEPDNSASKHWQQKNLDALCACTPDPYETVNCFQVQVNNNRKTWQEAIAACRSKP